MRNRAPLALMEQVIMILVFAVAAALCLQAFAWAQQRSGDNAARDQAMIRLESAAEVLKSANGDMEKASEYFGVYQNGVWNVRYDENWTEVAEGGVYSLSAEPSETDDPLLGEASLRVTDAEGESLGALRVASQEVEGHG